MSRVFPLPAVIDLDIDKLSTNEDIEECQGCSVLYMAETLDDDSLCDVCRVEEAPPPFGKQPSNTKVTTDDCREFLADYFSRNLVVLDHPFYAITFNRIEKLTATNPKKWKRESKYSATNHEYGEDEYAITQDDGSYTMLPAQCFLTVRKFYLDGSNEKVGFLVLEDCNNQLWMGEDCAIVGRDDEDY